MSRRALLGGLAGLPFAAGFAAPAPAAPAESRLAFRILHGGQEIGRHSVSLSRRDGFVRAEIATDLDVRVAFLVVYRYRHRASETWRDGRLRDLSAWTDDDGRETRVRVVPDGTDLAIDGPDGRRIAAADLVPNSYWNIAALRPGPGRWLDSENGRVVSVNVASLPDARAPAPGALGFRIDGDKDHAPFEAFYAAADHRWIGLRFVARGAEVDYRPDA